MTYITLQHKIILKVEQKKSFFLGLVDKKLVHNGRYLIGPTIVGGKLSAFAEDLKCGGFLFQSVVHSDEMNALFGLAAELSELDARIVDQLGVLVEPAQAAELLEQVLTGHRGLKLKSLQASSQSQNKLAPHTSPSRTGLGRYQLEMVVEGGYLDLLRYLRELEAMPWKFFWEKVIFQTTEHPLAETRLQLYTLGAHHG